MEATTFTRPDASDEPSTLVDVFIDVTRKHKRPDTLNYKRDGRWVSVSSDEMLQRAETIAAEDVLHDLGAISMMASDSQAMGRVGEVICRTWQTAAKMKDDRGRLPEETGSNDNLRVRRYIAKYTINPAIAHGMSHEIGSVEVGKWADLVLWRPAFFGIKPEVVFKGGFPAWSVMGESNASLMTCEPLTYRPQWGAFGGAKQALSVTLMAQAAIDGRVPERLGLRSRCVAPVG